MKKEYQKKLDYIYRKKEPFANYAFSLYYFVRELHKESLEKQITDIFFFSREGKFLKQLYDIYANSQCDTGTAKTHYLINNDPTSSSSKNKKANELNIPIITEAQFLEMIGE